MFKSTGVEQVGAGRTIKAIKETGVGKARVQGLQTWRTAYNGEEGWPLESQPDMTAFLSADNALCF